MPAARLIDSALASAYPVVVKTVAAASKSRSRCCASRTSSGGAWRPRGTTGRLGGSELAIAAIECQCNPVTAVTPAGAGAVTSPRAAHPNTARGASPSEAARAAVRRGLGSLGCGEGDVQDAVDARLAPALGRRLS